MVLAKSMEMTGDIQPGWLEAFAAPESYLKKRFEKLGGRSANDLDDDGVSIDVLGALPMVQSPFAMRPHMANNAKGFTKAILEKNQAAAAEFEAETGKDVSDSLVVASRDDIVPALKLLNEVAANAKEQDKPIFLPLWDGQVVVMTIQAGKEHFSALV